jgi:hypothetical protein
MVFVLHAMATSLKKQKLIGLSANKYWRIYLERLKRENKVMIVLFQSAEARIAHGRWLSV